MEPKFKLGDKVQTRNGVYRFIVSSIWLNGTGDAWFYDNNEDQYREMELELISEENQ